MKVEIRINPALESIIKNKNQLITLDANVLIPPDRSKFGVRPYDFELFKRVWLDPLFGALPKLGIHEAVYDEVLIDDAKNYLDERINAKENPLLVYYDSLLSSEESVLRNTIEERISIFTKYSPALDNKEDRGEVKSLSYIAIKNLPYFVANDALAIQLVEKAKPWNTNLDNIQVVKMYELMYYLYLSTKTDKKGLRMIYRYLFYLTGKEKETNPSWSDFLDLMNSCYDK